MTALGFYLARLRRSEAALQSYSAPLDLAGRHVALVGNARSLAEGRFGADIDAADLVIRMNGAPMPGPHSHGTRTDWLAISTPQPRRVMNARAPARILWMTPKRKRLPYGIARRPGFYLHPAQEGAALAKALGSSATTGALLIDLLARSDVAKIDLYGFDFFQSLSLSGSRSAADVPHDFEAEKAWVAALLERDERFALHQV